jgi:hypothetical protein
MNVYKNIELSKEELDEAVHEYLAKRDITFNVDDIYYATDHNGVITKVSIDAR